MRASAEQKNSVRALFPLRQMGGTTVHHMQAHGMAPILRLAQDNPLVKAMVEDREDFSDWIGFDRGETLAGSTASGFAHTPLRYFDKALARVQARAQVGGRSIPAMAGGAWIIPKAIAGLPMAAMAKPRTRLPMKAFKFAVQVSSSVNAADIATRCAMIARAAWEYTLAGGLAQVTISYYYNYLRPAPDGARAAIFDITLPLNNKAELAYACSSLAYRGILMGIAGTLLSPVDHDGLPISGAIQKLDGRVMLDGHSGDIPLIEKALAS